MYMYIYIHSDDINKEYRNNNRREGVILFGRFLFNSSRRVLTNGIQN